MQQGEEGASESRTQAVYLAGFHGSGGGKQVVEEASPISSRPPANLEELMRFSADDGGGGGGGVGGGSGLSGNRWPRDETLALLRIRSEMDATFRDARVKGPLWEHVSRKLAELGYKRSAKKCKEKFENVQKYYKRTKEGRGGSQDGKTYKFFSQLEALNTATTSAATAPPPPPHATAATSTTLDVAPLSIGIPPPRPMHLSSFSQMRNPPPGRPPLSTIGVTSFPYTNLATAAMPGVTSFDTTAPHAARQATSFGITTSSNSSSTASPSGYDEDAMDAEPSNSGGFRSRKRTLQTMKGCDRSSSSRRMMEFFKRITRQVIQKQEDMQRSFLEVLENRERERLIKEEAWKRQEMARLAREHQLIAQERAASASRDAAIFSLIQKITGQTILLPPPVVVSTVSTPLTQPQPQPQPAPATAVTETSPPISSPLQQQQPLHQNRHQYRQYAEVVKNLSNASSQAQAVKAIPEQQIPPPQQHQETWHGGSSELASSRWPKAEVLALLNLRSGLESKYQEACPKGPLWEEISAGMQRLGYKRSAKRCKEKWENVNKYFKKVKESNKKRREDAKTCPYFHQLDALYRSKVLGSSSSYSIQHRPQEQPSTQHMQESRKIDPHPAIGTDEVPASKSENENRESLEENSSGSLFGEGNEGAPKNPEDLVRELMEKQGNPAQQHAQEQQQLMVNDYEKIDDHSYNLDQDEDEGEDEDDDELDENGKMAYKIEFQQSNTSASDRGGNSGAPSLTMVQ